MNWMQKFNSEKETCQESNPLQGKHLGMVIEDKDATFINGTDIVIFPSEDCFLVRKELTVSELKEKYPELHDRLVKDGKILLISK